ncbi:MAG: glycosyltransferase [Planctomycetota bacterium]
MISPNEGGPARADLHIHTKYSDRPSEWWLRRIGAPESFVEPLDLYRAAKERGMRFVTISDHNRIDGALEIAHLPDTFISNEVTTYFPEDGAKVHILVNGITEAQFRDIQEVRSDIYEFRRYVIENDIPTSVAHPLYRVNDLLTADHVEKLLLLFNTFEGINGMHGRRNGAVFEALLDQLTEQDIGRLAEDHGIAPVGERPWEKSLTGGSDDHSGLYVASAHTVTPPAETVDEFLDHLRAGRHAMAGTRGSSLQLARSLCSIAYSYYAARFQGGSGVLSAMFARLAGAPTRPASLKLRLKLWAGRMLRRRRADQVLLRELENLFGEDKGHDARGDRRTFEIACRITHLLGYESMRRFQRYATEGRLIDSLQTIASMAPVGLSIAPYFASFNAHHKDEPLLRELEERYPAIGGATARKGGKAWLTDTFTDVNGVARTIRRLTNEARDAGLPMRVITSLPENPSEDGVVNFPPVGTFPMPEYEDQTLAFPPFLEIMEYVEREDIEELILSTPGPLGLTGLAAAHTTGIKTCGIYHTDFPAYVARLTEDTAVAAATQRYVDWFYKQLDTVFVRSEHSRRQLLTRGYAARKLKVLPAGIDPTLFHTGRRRPDFWSSRGLDDPFTFLYVGRVSREKGLPVLLDAFELLHQRGVKANLAIVGDGPSRAAWARQYKTPGLHFTGYLRGFELAEAYASSDLFVFPSRTDTLGNVIIEAHACGLPAVVTGSGGPRGIVQERESGIVVDRSGAEAFADAMERIYRDEEGRRAMVARGLETARHRSWAASLEILWGERAAAEPIMSARSTARELVRAELGLTETLPDRP